MLITNFLFGSIQRKPTDTLGKAYALVGELKVGDYVTVDDAIAATTNLMTYVPYFVWETDLGELFILDHDEICNFYLDGQHEKCLNTGKTYYTGIYKV